MRFSVAQIGAVAGVAALAVVVGVLSAVALQQGNPESPERTASPPPTFEFGSPDTTPPSPTNTPTPAPTHSAADERFLAIQGDRLWRATAGECGGVPPVVELSTDGGASWTDVTPPDAAQVLTTAALADIAGEVVAAVGEDCEPTVLRTYTSGVEWSTYPQALGDMTFLSPSDGVTVVRPGDDVKAPCDDARSVRASRGVVGLICDGDAYALLDGDWVPLTEDAVAVDAVAGTIVVAHTSETCAGVAATQFNGASANPMTCFDDTDPVKPTAISLLSRNLALWSGRRSFFAEGTRRLALVPHNEATG